MDVQITLNRGKEKSMAEQMITLEECIIKTFKPCPFCGNTPTITKMSMESEIGIDELVIECCMEFRIRTDDAIRVETFTEGTKYMQLGLTAVEKWNRRAEHEAD